MIYVDFQIFFDCPVHGLEDQVFCFRASDTELNHRWIKYEIIRTRVEIAQDEIEVLRALFVG